MVDKNLFLHDLSVVAILKNESLYLKEWLDYHLAAGVEHFYLYDNDSTDNQAEVVKPYIAAGLVDYFPLPGKAMQYVAYNDAVKRFKFHCRYMTFIDGDEFVYPKVDGGGILLQSSTKFYRITRTRRACRLIGKFTARTDKRRLITLAASWKDLLGAHLTIGILLYIHNLSEAILTLKLFSTREWFI